jgi:hypothetical protein
MIKDFNCCQQLLPDSARNSPFGRIISLGFYDGTTSGVAQCSHCLKSYRYELVAWDSGQDIRVYSIASLPSESFDALVKLLSATQSAVWPFWSPVFPPDSASASTLSTAIDSELAKADLPALVIASRRLDIEILASKDLTNSARIKLPKGRNYPNMHDWDFWRAYLMVDSLPEPTG